MCSISGIINHHGDQNAAAELQTMMAVQKHRGPDDAGTFLNDDVALGHNRLSIIDLAGGHQPMLTANGRLAVIFNGEIYNFREIRRELTERGHHFRTAGDTECILHLYEQFGDECVSRLDGMFAFALYDIPKRRLLLARDRLGQKPLHYFMNGNTLVFASELPGLLAHSAAPKELDKEALSDFLSLQYIPQPNTAFRKIRKLPPGHLLVQNLESGQISIRCYWQADYSIKNSEMSFDTAAVELRKLVEKAVEKRLVSEVPLGCFLSGGVDSAIVTGVAAKLLYPAPCEAFTAGFGVENYDEREAAKRSAEIINRVSGGNLCCHEKEIKPDDFSLLDEIFPHFGEPFADASSIPFYLLSRFAKEKISVALSGDGADEVFAGYERYLAMRYAERIYLVPQPLRQAIFGLLAKVLPDRGERTRSGRLNRLLRLFAATPEEGYFNLLDRCPRRIKEELFGQAMQKTLRHNSAECLTGLYWELIAPERVEKLAELDLRTYLPGDILVKSDIASMAASLELRSPFMDKEVVEFTARLPLNYKLDGRERKHILKAAFPEFITPEISARPKRGFGVPLASWLRHEWKDQAHDRLFHASRLIEGGFVRAKTMQRCWDLHQEGGADFSYLLWDLLILELFLERQPDNAVERP